MHTSTEIDISHALTPRERDVLRCVMTGKRNREIAGELGLCEQSVKNLLSTIYLKCDVRNRLELVLVALRSSNSGANPS